jgi:hypothetical protein
MGSISLFLLGNSSFRSFECFNGQILRLNGYPHSGLVLIRQDPLVESGERKVESCSWRLNMF